MKRLVFMACVACGGPAANGEGTTAIVVPQQPPQPTATAVVSPANVDAGMVATAPAKPFECPGGQRFETTSRSYCAYADALSWDAAEHRCVETGGHLATLDSTPTSMALKSVLGSPLSVPRAAWIGLELKKTGTKKEWRWSNGAAVTTASWNDGEPNDFYRDGSEACGEWLVSDGRWNDTRCDLQSPFICQMSKAPLACASGIQKSILDGKYCLNTGLQTHANAKKSCSVAGGVLAGPIPEADQEALKKAIAARFAPRRFWIGLNDIAEEGQFTWSSGANFHYTEWHEGEPNDFQEEDCVEVYADTWTWNDSDCGAPKASLCEGPAKKK